MSIFFVYAETSLNQRVTRGLFLFNDVFYGARNDLSEVINEIRGGIIFIIEKRVKFILLKYE